jgi:hypothetical protein
MTSRPPLQRQCDPTSANKNICLWTDTSLAIWDWLAGTLRMPSVESPCLNFGVSGHRHDPHGVMGLVVNPAVNAVNALIGLVALKRTAAGPEPPSVGHKSLPAADSQV